MKNKFLIIPLDMGINDLEVKPLLRHFLTIVLPMTFKDHLSTTLKGSMAISSGLKTIKQRKD